MRYEARFRNGYWALFDHQMQAHVDTFGLGSDASKAAAEANATGTWRRQFAAGYQHPWKLAGER